MILEGSGRIADVIAQVAGLPLTKVTISLIHQLMKKFFGLEYENFSDLKIIEWTKKVDEYSPSNVADVTLHVLNVHFLSRFRT